MINKPERIIAHCAGTPVEANFTHKDVYEWHTKENGWSTYGYHYIIETNGDIIICRPLHQSGAHCKDGSQNHRSIGICFMGGYKGTSGKTNWDKCTDEQAESFTKLKMSLDLIYGKNFEVVPHSEYSDTKSCPNFDLSKIGY